VDVGGGGDGGEKTAGHAVTQPDSATCSVNSSFGSVRSLPKDTGHSTTIRCPRTRSKPSPVQGFSCALDDLNVWKRFNNIGTTFPIAMYAIPSPHPLRRLLPG
jgi:hypothetical protein